jgi:hypothetical protein
MDTLHTWQKCVKGYFVFGRQLGWCESRGHNAAFKLKLEDHSLLRDTPSRHPGRAALGASWSMRIRQWKILLIR